MLIATRRPWELALLVKVDSSLSERFLDSVTNRLIGALDDLVPWIEQFHPPTGFSEVLGELPNHEFSKAYLASGFVLFELAGIQGLGSWDVFMGSPAAVNLALTAWITPVQAQSWQGAELGPYPFACTARFLPTKMPCPIMILFMTTLLSTRERRRVLVDMVGRGETQAEWIVWGASRRMQMLNSFVQQDTALVSAETAAMHFLNLYRTVHFLGEEPVFRKVISQSLSWTLLRQTILTISGHGGRKVDRAQNDSYRPFLRKNDIVEEDIRSLQTLVLLRRYGRFYSLSSATAVRRRTEIFPQYPGHPQIGVS